VVLINKRKRKMIINKLEPPEEHTLKSTIKDETLIVIGLVESLSLNSERDVVFIRSRLKDIDVRLSKRLEREDSFSIELAEMKKRKKKKDDKQEREST